MFGRLVDWFFVIGSLLGLAATGWWSVHGGPDSAANLQSQLDNEVQVALAAAGHDWARVELDGQQVVLSGQSPSYGSLEEAVEVVNGVGGMGFLPTVLRPVTALVSEAESAAPVAPYVWSAERTMDGEIILDGYVPSPAIMEVLLNDARGLGDVGVRSRMQIGSGEPLGDWAGVAQKSLELLAIMDFGTVDLVDSQLSINGVASEDGARAAILDALALLDPPYRAQADIRGQSLWSARHVDAALILAGMVSSEAEREEILAIATGAFDGSVRDQMQVGPGAYDGWMETIRAGLPHFAQFRSGQLTFAPRAEGFTFGGEATGSTLVYLANDLPESAFETVLNVETVDPELGELAGIDIEADPAGGCQAGFDAVMASNSIAFESGEVIILRESGPALDKVMALARRCQGLRFEVRGHTDTSGGRDANISISRSRAEAVMAYMVARGISGADIEAVGLGPDDPIADNETRAGRAANRRIEFAIMEEG